VGAGVEGNVATQAEDRLAARSGWPVFCENEHVRIFSYTMIFVASRIGHWASRIAHSQIEFLIEFLIESLINPGGLRCNARCPMGDVDVECAVMPECSATNNRVRNSWQ
jgi:hypothetical protein